MILSTIESHDDRVDFISVFLQIMGKTKINNNHCFAVGYFPKNKKIFFLRVYDIHVRTYINIRYRQYVVYLNIIYNAG